MSRRVWAKLTSEQELILQTYAEWYGKDWQGKLMNDWMRSGTHAPVEWGPLQRLRNTHGPLWLAQTHPVT